jgi:hypothetical protein
MLKTIAYHGEFANEKGELPGINLGTPRDKEWFAAAKLNILPYQIYRRPVPDHLTDVMLKRAAKTPEEGVPLINDVFNFLRIRDVLGSDSVSFVSHEPTSMVLTTDVILGRLPAINHCSQASRN